MLDRRSAPMLSRQVLLSAIVAVSMACSDVAGAVERLGWEDLAPPMDQSGDPLQRLPQDLQVDFYDLMWARSLIADMKKAKKTHNSVRAVGRMAQGVTAELTATEAEARVNLVAAGIDIEALIAETEAYNETLEARNMTLVDELDGREVQIPGYVLPLEYAGTEITEFLLVPYVGACIHGPPPPPNQIVHVRIPDGFEDQGLFTPVWVVGRLSTGHSSQSLFFVDGVDEVAVGYSLDASDIEIYDE